MKKKEESQDDSLYYDEKKFKGNTFENNINAINKLYLGQGLKISETPYIIINEKDKNTYLVANSFTFKDKNEITKTINYPTSFKYRIFYHNNIIFYFDIANTLNVYKFFDKECQKIVIENDKSKQQKVLKLSLKKENIDSIVKKFQEINKCSDAKEVYEILCKILQEDLKELKTEKTPKKINGTLTFNIQKVKEDKIEKSKEESNENEMKEESKEEIKEKNLKKKQDNISQINANNNVDSVFEIEYTCSIKQLNIQVDGSGFLREEIKLKFGKVSFDDGIKTINSHFTIIQNGDKISSENTFKCPFLFKNFDEDKIPPNQAILFEYKSGFDIDSLTNQLKERIQAVRGCFFIEGEKPTYFIGIVNLNSKNKDKINNFSGYEINLNEKILIIVTIDYEYFGQNLSFEVSDGYLLYKNMEDKFSILDKKIDTKFEELKNLILSLHPNTQSTHKGSQLNSIKCEEKKDGNI